jgi:hypothetical protein
MKEQIIEVSKKFWKALEAADTATMRAQCDPKCLILLQEVTHWIVKWQW